MRRVLLTIAMVVAFMNAMCQEIDIATNDAGEYEKKAVVEVDSATAGVLYGRAMEALGECGDASMKVEIDFSDKESGTVSGKGLMYLGYHVIKLRSINRYGNFTIRVKCKDGRAQVVCKVTGFKLVVENGQMQTYSVADILKNMDDSKKVMERWTAILTDMKGKVDRLVQTVCERLKSGDPDDEF